MDAHTADAILATEEMKILKASADAVFPSKVKNNQLVQKFSICKSIQYSTS